MTGVSVFAQTLVLATTVTKDIVYVFMFFVAKTRRA